MQEIIRRCDMPVKQGRGTVPHGKVITSDKPVDFGLEGVAYESDLCDEHIQALRDCLAPFIAISIGSSRMAGGTSVRRTMKGKKGGFTTKDVRVWMKEQGRDVAPSGRLPNEVIEEYRAAHAN